MNATHENEIISCKDENKIYFEDGPYNNCSDIYPIINPNDENEGVSCKNEKAIYFKNGCYIIAQKFMEL